MPTHSVEERQSQRPLRVVIEIRDGELLIYSTALTDEEERQLWDALRFIVDEEVPR